jgi:cytoskeletal protein RodZ
MSPLGETLQRARLSRGVTFEEAERVTRISRKYLEALELENFSILPAPVFARGFLRSYADYLGLDPAELLPFFPVGHVEEPKLEPLPEVSDPRTWNMSSLLAVGVMGFLILLVILLYSVGREESNPTFAGEGNRAAAPDVITNPEPAPPVGPASALPDLVGQSEADAIAMIDATGASYVIVRVQEGDVPVGQVIEQRPARDALVGAGDTVTIVVSR